MSYFGYPVAHEDDAVRAIRAALRILTGIRLVNEGIGKRLHAEIQVRAGIHTGIAVVGEIGPGGEHDRLAVGQTVNLAARIQGFAEVGTTVVSASTAKLAGGHFDLDSLGAQTLRGFSQPIELFRVARATNARTRLEATARHGLTPHVGREVESARLAAIWRDVREGADRVVVVRGEAGIGKSRIVHQFREAILAEPARVIECFCTPFTQSTAFATIVETIERTIVERSDGDTTTVAKFAALTSLLGEYSPRFGAGRSSSRRGSLVASWSRRDLDRGTFLARRRLRTLEILREWMGSVGEHLPVALLIEDAHWADPSTLDLLDPSSLGRAPQSNPPLRNGSSRVPPVVGRARRDNQSSLVSSAAMSRPS